MNEAGAGVLLLFFSIFILCACLIGMVKVLSSLMNGPMSTIIRKTINADFPGVFHHLTGYVTILVGAGLTVLVQSSSVFTSAITPLVGLGVVTLERVYPLTLGANIGTTITSLLAALAGDADYFSDALQIAFVHLFFNISGILLWYPVPILRRVPVRAAKTLGNTTAEYRWFSIAYLLVVFFLCPALVFALSIPGWYVLLSVMLPIVIIIGFVIIVNVSQSRCPSCLPTKLQSWDWLPLCCRSLEPYDRLFRKCCVCCKICQMPNQDSAVVPVNNQGEIIDKSGYAIDNDDTVSIDMSSKVITDVKSGHANKAFES